MVEYNFRSGISSGYRAAQGSPDMAETSGWTLRVLDDVSWELLCSLDTCHHLGMGQFFTTTDPPFPTYWSLRKGSQGSEVDWRDS